MTHAQFLRIKKLTGKAIIEIAARHNHREILAELGTAPGGHIDPERVGLNRVLRGHGTAAAVASQAKRLMDDAGVKPLKRTAVMALEIIFGLPPQSAIDHDQFFNEAVKWAEQYFGVPVISAIVHNDEAAPHCHVLLLPLVDGRMIGSDLMGGRAKLQGLQADFHSLVGQRHGLTRQTAQKRHSAATRRQAIDSAFDVLEANSGLSPAVLLALLVPHMSDPEPLLLALGLTMPAEKVKPKDTFIGIMTRPCKPEPKPIGIGKRNPIGIDNSGAPKKELSLSCVGIGFSAPSNSTPNDASQAAPATTTEASRDDREQVQPAQPTAPTASSKAGANHLPTVNTITLPSTPEPEPQADDPDDGYTRERDTDTATDYWDCERGEFARPSIKTSSRNQAAKAVQAALQRRAFH